MVKERAMTKEIAEKMFASWDETIIWSCLQGIMGEIHINKQKDAAMAILGEGSKKAS